MLRGMEADIIERINETEVGKFEVVARDGRIGRFDVQVGNVVREDRDFVPCNS